MKSRKKERRWERKGKQQQQQQKQQQQQQNQQQQQQQKRGTQRTTRAQGRAPQRRSVRARAGAARSVSRVADSDDETRAAISGLDRHLNFCSVFFFAFRADRIRSCRVSEIIGIIERDRLGGFRYAKKKNKQKIIAHMEVAERRNRSATAWWPLAWRIWETRYNSVRAASRSDTGPSEFSWRPVEKKKKIFGSGGGGTDETPTRRNPVKKKRQLAKPTTLVRWQRPTMWRSDSAGDQDAGFIRSKPKVNRADGGARDGVLWKKIRRENPITSETASEVKCLLCLFLFFFCACSISFCRGYGRHGQCDFHWLGRAGGGGGGGQRQSDGAALRAHHHQR